MREKSDLPEPARLGASGGTWPMSASGHERRFTRPTSISAYATLANTHFHSLLFLPFPIEQIDGLQRCLGYIPEWFRGAIRVDAECRRPRFS